MLTLFRCDMASHGRAHGPAVSVTRLLQAAFLTAPMLELAAWFWIMLSRKPSLPYPTLAQSNSSRHRDFESRRQAQAKFSVLCRDFVCLCESAPVPALCLRCSRCRECLHALSLISQLVQATTCMCMHRRRQAMHISPEHHSTTQWLQGALEGLLAAAGGALEGTHGTVDTLRPPYSAVCAAMAQDSASLQLLLSILEVEGENFYLQYTTVQLLSRLVTASSGVLQDAVLARPQVTLCASCMASTVRAGCACANESPIMSEAVHKQGMQNTYFACCNYHASTAK